MWIFLNDSFLSVVQHNKEPDRLVVRSRRKEDLERTFGADPMHTPGADYAYRIEVSRKQLMMMLTDRVARLDYVNFKDSVKETNRHNTYLAVWQRVKYDAEVPLLKAEAASKPMLALQRASKCTLQHLQEQGLELNWGVKLEHLFVEHTAELYHAERVPQKIVDQARNKPVKVEVAACVAGREYSCELPVRMLNRDVALIEADVFFANFS